MENYCVLCGEVLEEGKTFADHHEFKKMCVNCEHSNTNADGELVCENEANKAMFFEKMKEAASAVTDCYSIDEFKISPLPLKKPTGKCKQWKLDQSVIEQFEGMFK